MRGGQEGRVGEIFCHSTILLLAPAKNSHKEAPYFPHTSHTPRFTHTRATPSQNLDLIVTPPVGPVAYGNSNLPPTGGQQTQGSLANGTATGQIPDTLNNVERLKFPVPGTGWGTAPYLVQVRGTALPMGGTQRYSLVVTGPGIVISYPPTQGTGVTPAACPPVPLTTEGQGGGGFSNSTQQSKW
jgi:hypothetical protein